MKHSFRSGATAAGNGDGQAATRKDHLVLASLIGVYLAILAVMGIRGEFGFLWKTILVPFFFVAALVSGRGLKFVEDWGVFLSLVVLFDCLRGLVFALVTHYELPFYMNYAIDAETWLGRGAVFPSLLQKWWGHGSHAATLNKALVLVHASHFFAFLMFGLVVWTLRPAGFRKYAAGMLSIMYVGAVFYLLIPTVPPWMAANALGVLPPIRPISSELYSVNFPTLQQTFDVNPIAAMPSLHAAFPTLCALIGFRHFRWRALPVAVYALLVYAAIVYLGEHYLVDVFAGMAFAVILYLVIYTWGGLQRPWAALTRRLPRWGVLARHPLARAIVFSMVIVAGSEGVGRVSAAIRKPMVMTPAFIRRELGRYPGMAENQMFEYAAARSKYRSTLVEAKIYGDMGSHAQSVAVIEGRISRSGPDPELLSWLGYFKYRAGLIDKEALGRTFALLERSLDAKRAAFMRDFLLPSLEASTRRSR